MIRKRKTHDVEALRRRVNEILADPSSGSAPRAAIASLLEGVLLDTGNYKGFGYIAWLNGGCSRWEADGRPDDTTPYLGDQTMRIYW